MNRRLALIGIVVGTALLLGACGRSEPTPEETTLTKVGQTAPDFTVTTLDGRPFHLDAERGKVVVLDFFATWCPPCREEMPHLEQQVWQRFKGDRFAMLALGREHVDTELLPFVKEFDLTFPVAADTNRDAFGLYAEEYIPRTVVVGADGTILFQSTGYEPKEFEHMIAVITKAVQAAGEAPAPPASSQPAQAAG